MTYRIEALAPARFAPFFAMSDSELEAVGARRVRATGNRGFPCRIAMRDAREGDSLILLNYESLSGPTPYKTTYAIYVGENAEQAPDSIDALPELMRGRALALRGFGLDGLLRRAELVAPGNGREAGETIGAMFADRQIAAIHVHNATYGCFLGRAVRDGETA